jgi:hypothetical protein
MKVYMAGEALVAIITLGSDKGTTISPLAPTTKKRSAGNSAMFPVTETKKQKKEEVETICK